MPITVTTRSNGTVPIVTTPTQPVLVTVPTGKPGPQGPPGPPGQDAQWMRLTQAQYDALPTKDSAVLYVIIN